jgi:hypothetical protein
MSTFGDVNDVGVPEEREKMGFPGCPPIEFGGLLLHSPSHLTFVVATRSTTTSNYYIRQPRPQYMPS